MTQRESWNRVVKNRIIELTPITIVQVALVCIVVYPPIILKIKKIFLSYDLSYNFKLY